MSWAGIGTSVESAGEGLTFYERAVTNRVVTKVTFPQIMDLKMKLLDVVHRNEELSEILAKKDQELEQQDKNSRGQARVIKVIFC